MMDFDLLPDDKAMENMAKEYRMIKNRNGLLEQTAAVAKKLTREEAEKVARAYYLASDLIDGTRKLYAVSPAVYRPDIEEMIGIKRENASVLLDLYVSSEGEPLNYDRRFINNKGFCNQLKELLVSQGVFLGILSELVKTVPELTSILLSELVVGYGYQRLAVTCNFPMS